MDTAADGTASDRWLTPVSPPFLQHADRVRANSICGGQGVVDAGNARSPGRGNSGVTPLGGHTPGFGQQQEALL
ncbi:hypothetical protein [Saccharomonospora cyanea]|uniref:hypothetical protein n=1 Tax=Saccharomonospora cyanea TaxID=40989 RepID=UPI0003165FD8|nr:hypothetical protein [Saccharomonospora cyanea]